MSHDDVIRFWGVENLKRWSFDDLCDAAIPNRSKQFLTQVGLPLENGWTLRFNGESSVLPRLPGRPEYRRIGFDYDVPICLDEKKHGCVLSVEPPDVTRYINASVEQFGICLTLYQQYRTRVQGMDEDDAQNLIRRIEDEMRRVDPTAFADPECWWLTIFEQMRLGCL